jgi:Icc protein
MKIAQITDCHLFADSNKVGYKQINPFTSLRLILKEVALHRPDMLLVTGDLTTDGTAQSYRHFSTLLQQTKMSCAYYILPGNHDNQQQLQETFPASQLWQTDVEPFLDSPWLVHLLNTQGKGNQGHLSANDLAQLEKKLVENNDRFHLLAVHHHPLPCGGWMDKHQWQNRDEFNQLVARHESVKTIIYGHIHMDIQQQQHGSLYLACPSTCWQWQNSENFGLSPLMPGYRMLNLHHDGQITTTVHRLEESF